MIKNNCPYNSRLMKGAALLDDMRLLVRKWSNEAVGDQYKALVKTNLLGKGTRTRTSDTYRRVFVPRFLEGDPPNAWQIVRELEDYNLPLEILRPVYYWITARSDRLVYDYVSEELLPRSKSHDPIVRTDEVAFWITKRLAKFGKVWSPDITKRVARGILAALRDFGILEGAVKKQIAPAYLPIEAFAYIAFALHFDGISGQSLVGHPDWAIFLLSAHTVEHHFLEADRNGLLKYQAAGKIVRIDFPAQSYKEMANVVTARAH